MAAVLLILCLTLRQVEYMLRDKLFQKCRGRRRVYADLCWLPLISTSAAKRFLREALEIGGSNRILWGCDTWTSEESYGAVLAFRRVVSEVLSEMCQEGYLSCEEACYTVGQIWRGNALKLFGFEN